VGFLVQVVLTCTGMMQREFGQDCLWKLKVSSLGAMFEVTPVVYVK
jgi:hypothetical protein